MRLAWAGLLCLGTLFAGTQDSEFNVNTRYTVETVIVSGDGWATNLAFDQNAERISASLRKQIAALIGDKLNPAMLDALAASFCAPGADSCICSNAAPRDTVRGLATTNVTSGAIS